MIPMKRLICVSAVALILSGCFISVKSLSGIVLTETFDVPSDYEAVHASGAVSVMYSTEADVMTVEADSVVMADFEYSVSDNSIRLGRKSDAVTAYNGDPSISVILPVSTSLSTVKLSGASSFTSETVIAVPHFSVTLSGASGFKGDVDADELDVHASGASEVDICGYAEQACYNVSGASHVSSDERHVRSETVSVSVSGASGLDTGASKRISGSVSGASSVICFGNPETQVVTSGASSFNLR